MTSMKSEMVSNTKHCFVCLYLSCECHHLLSTTTDGIFSLLVERSGRRTRQYLLGGILRILRAAVLALKCGILLETFHQFITVLASHLVSTICFFFTNLKCNYFPPFFLEDN